jgi:hypothetical protein
MPEILICESCHFSFEQQEREMVCLRCQRALIFFGTEFIKAGQHTRIAASLFWGYIGLGIGILIGILAR